MTAPEKSPSESHASVDGVGDLASELDEMIAEGAAGDGGAALPDEALGPEPSPLDDIPNPEETLAGLDEMLSEAAEKAQVTLGPLDEPEDVDPFADAEDDAEPEAEAAAADEAVATEDDEAEAASIAESMDDGEVTDSATELAHELEGTLHGEPAEESLYDDDPDETDAPEIYGPGEAFNGDAAGDDAGAEPEVEAAQKNPDDVASVEAPPGEAELADETEAEAEAAIEPKPSRGSPIGKLAGALAPVARAGGPIKGVSISLANVLSIPLARLSPEHRDLVGYAAVTLLFNALCLIVVLLFM